MIHTTTNNAQKHLQLIIDWATRKEEFSLKQFWLMQRADIESTAGLGFNVRTAPQNCFSLLTSHLWLLGSSSSSTCSHWNLSTNISTIVCTVQSRNCEGERERERCWRLHATSVEYNLRLFLVTFLLLLIEFMRYKSFSRNLLHLLIEQRNERVNGKGDDYTNFHRAKERKQMSLVSVFWMNRRRMMMKSDLVDKKRHLNRMNEIG